MSTTGAPRKQRNAPLDLSVVTDSSEAAPLSSGAMPAGTMSAVPTETRDDVDLGVGTGPGSLGFLVTYGFFFFAGASSVAMWSAITLSLDFFAQKYPNDRVGFMFPVVNMSTVLVISLFMVLAGRHWPLEPRVNGSLATYLAFLLVLPLVNVWSSMHGHFAYMLTLLALVGSTVSSSVLNATAYGLAGIFGPTFIQALDGGKGFGAMLLFVVRLLLKWMFQLPATVTARASTSQDHEAAMQMYYTKVSMVIFFGVAFAIVAITWVLYVAMKYMSFAKPMMDEYFLIQHDTPFTEPAFSPMASPMAGSPRKSVFSFTTDGNAATLAERSPLLPRRSSLERENSDYYSSTNDDDGGVVDEFTRGRREHTSSALILTVFRTAAKPFFTLFLSFFVCLSCFPGIIAAIPSTTLDVGDWFPIILVGCYNLGDLIGKNLPLRVMYFDVSTLHLPWLLQLAFLPFFVATLVHPFSDLVTILATLFLGLVTGYVATSAMILAPTVCSEYQKEVAGMIGSLCAVIGLCAGSYNGLALETIIQLWQDWFGVE